MTDFISTQPTTRPDRRRALFHVFGVAFAAGSALPFAALAQPRTYDAVVHRDRGCGCCHAWSVSLGRTGRFRTTLTDEADMPALKRRLGVPADLVSCHTAEVDGFVIEGHVPAGDVLRLLTERPAGVRGLAARGMPIGSPGMEQPNGAREAFEVFAFRAGGARSVFARHA